MGARLGIIAALCMAAAVASPLSIIVDENGNMLINGVPSMGYISDDPGPGGLTNVLTYTLPFAGFQGDVVLGDATGCGCISDLIRFNGDGTLIFYSANYNGFDSLADTPTPPQDVYSNILSVPEFGDNFFSSADYTPGPEDPGYDVLGPTYTFVSDSTVPEPGTTALITGGLGAFWYLSNRRRRAARVIKETSGHPSSDGRAADS